MNLQQLLCLVITLGGASFCLAQAPYAPVPLAQPSGFPMYLPSRAPLNYLPNFFNRQQQPLSPYLNLLNGGIPGLNYYYGVRPGLPTGGLFPMAPRTPAATSRPTIGLGNNAPNTTPPTPIGTPTLPGQTTLLPPSGHPVIYGNNQSLGQSAIRGYGPANRSVTLGQSATQQPGKQQ